MILKLKSVNFVNKNKRKRKSDDARAKARKLEKQKKNKIPSNKNTLFLHDALKRWIILQLEDFVAVIDNSGFISIP